MQQVCQSKSVARGDVEKGQYIEKGVPFYTTGTLSFTSGFITVSVETDDELKRILFIPSSLFYRMKIQSCENINLKLYIFNLQIKFNCILFKATKSSWFSLDSYIL
jgi:hypothetical protein